MYNKPALVTEKPRKLMQVIRDYPNFLDFNVIALCGGDGGFHELVNVTICYMSDFFFK